MASVEDYWFIDEFADRRFPEPWASAPWDEHADWEFTTAHDVPTEDLFARCRDAIARSNAELADIVDLGTLASHGPGDGEPWSIRWIVVHMIEETTRHCGHAGLIRESLDGATGDMQMRYEL
jgi:uncharacterized protein DUF664